MAPDSTSADQADTGPGGDVPPAASSETPNQTMTDIREGGEPEVVLKRKVGIFGCIAMVVGIIIGSGIFVSPQVILVYTDGVIGYSFLAWIICGLFSSLGALCFVELSTTIPLSGGDFAYILQAWGPFVAFIRMWMSLFISYPGEYAIIILIASQYLVSPFLANCDDLPQVAIQLFTMVILCAIYYLNCVSVRWTTRVQVFFTAAKVSGLVIIILGGVVQLCRGKTEHFANAFSGYDNPTSFPLALNAGIFAFSGWQYLMFITEEVQRPARNIPLGVIISMILVTSIYLLTNVSYLTVLSPPEIINSNAVAVDFAKRLFPVFAWIMSIFVALSCTGTVNGALFGSSRILYVAGREGLMPKLMSMIHVRKKTPLPAAIFTLPIAILMVLNNDIFLLLNFVAFIEWIMNFLAVAIIPYYRWKHPDLPRPFKVPIVVPIIYMLGVLFVLGMALYASPRDCGLGIVAAASGIPVYLIGVWWKNKPPAFQNAIDKTTLFLQKLLLVVSPEPQTKSE
ncbi:cystine/glutamate transporter-like [Lytechinus pictus]|uniref:cystine/glutamate transporter-like n=1 Tax=Lytechinus pictus TaxID=7653 RepID=UPI00240E7952|nr:cystine/glutamate transporter-like [Lytechinus pictus]